MNLKKLNSELLFLLEFPAISSLEYFSLKIYNSNGFDHFPLINEVLKKIQFIKYLKLYVSGYNGLNNLNDRINIMKISQEF